jgi:hypothetical protein
MRMFLWCVVFAAALLMGFALYTVESWPGAASVVP